MSSNLASEGMLVGTSDVRFLKTAIHGIGQGKEAKAACERSFRGFAGSKRCPKENVLAAAPEAFSRIRAQRARGREGNRGRDSCVLREAR
eukprot:4536953-Pleurochrysis_carterae.AAC.4